MHIIIFHFTPNFVGVSRRKKGVLVPLEEGSSPDGARRALLHKKGARTQEPQKVTNTHQLKEGAEDEYTVHVLTKVYGYEGERTRLVTVGRRK